MLIDLLVKYDNDWKKISIYLLCFLNYHKCTCLFQLNETLSSKLVCNDKPIIPPVDNLNNKTGIIVLKAFHGY